MGKTKREMKKIHQKNRRMAREKTKRAIAEGKKGGRK